MEGIFYTQSPLGRWLAQRGGSVNEHLQWRREPSGHRLEATKELQADEIIVSMPYDLAITPTLVTNILPKEYTSGLNDHMKLCLYIILHDLALAGEKIDTPLEHTEYVKLLPRPHQMRTAMWFTEAEHDLLKGSNLHPAVLIRRQEWQAEHANLLKIPALERFLSTLTWHRYLWASTVISSRAFPSYLLDGIRENATQILLPGIDAFNHRRGQAVTWFSNHKTKQMQFITDERIEAGMEVVNNYGAKPNDELLLGYGFVLNDNPEDNISLKMGSARDSAVSQYLASVGLPLTRPHHLKKDLKELPDEILAQLRALIAEEDELEALRTSKPAGESHNTWKSRLGFLSWDNEMSMVNQLGDMLSMKEAILQKAVERVQGAGPADERPSKRQRKEEEVAAQTSAEAEVAPEKVREEVRKNIQYYLEGQLLIINQSLDIVERMAEDVEKRARADGWHSEDEDASDGESEV